MPPITHAPYYTCPPLHKPPITQAPYHTCPLSHKPPNTHAPYYASLLSHKPPITHATYYTSPLLHKLPITHAPYHTSPLLLMHPITQASYHTSPLLYMPPITRQLGQAWSGLPSHTQLEVMLLFSFRLGHFCSTPSSPYRSVSKEARCSGMSPHEITALGSNCRERHFFSRFLSGFNGFPKNAANSQLRETPQYPT